ncbi:MAG: hypothetical protein ABEI52_08555, partial [Halobacteriaceae archaeon]
MPWQTPSVRSGGLTNTGFGFPDDVIEDPRSFSDDFEDGTIAGHWYPVGEPGANISESSGSLTVAQGTLTKGSDWLQAGVSSYFHYGPTVQVECDVQISNGSGGDGGHVVLHADPQVFAFGSESDYYGRGGSIQVVIEAGGTVALLVRDESGNNNDKTLSTTQGTTGTEFNVRILWNGENNLVTAIVDGNGETNRASADTSYADYWALRPGFAWGNADISANSFSVTGSSQPSRLFNVNEVYQAIHEGMVTNPP